MTYYRSWSRSVSIVSDYRLDDLGLIPGRGKGFFLASVSRPALRLTQPSLQPWLLGCCLCHLCKSCAVANIVYSRVGCVFIIEHYFASKSFAAVREALTSVYSDKELPNKRTTC
jgi:hypothetical protein